MLCNNSKCLNRSNPLLQNGGGCLESKSCGPAGTNSFPHEVYILQGAYGEYGLLPVTEAVAEILLPPAGLSRETGVFFKSALTFCTA